MAENRYQRGKIYKIVCDDTNKVYIGSTTELYLSNRLKGHRSACKSKKGICTSREIIQNNNYHI